MNASALVVAGLVLIALGGLWFLQGVGIVGGSFMTDDPLWVVIGSITALTGFVFLARGRGQR